MKHIVIVGGGIAGLSAAYHLQKAAVDGQPVEYTIVERDNRLGGKIATATKDGFVIEGGPDSFLTQKPWALDLCAEMGLTSRLIGTSSTARQVFVFSRGRLQPMPDGVMLIVPSRIGPFLRSPLISWPGKMRMGMDAFTPRRREDGDESLAHFVRRRLGSEALDKIAEPMIAGIYLADAERLSLKSTFPRFLDMEKRYGSLLRGVLAQRKQRPAPSQPTTRPRSMFMTLRGGLTEMVGALVARLDARSIKLGRTVVALERNSGTTAPGYTLTLDDGTILCADAVVLATPAYVSSDLLRDVAAPLAETLRRVRYVSSATVSLGYPRDTAGHLVAGSGFVVPRKEKRKIVACSYVSSKFEARAPEDCVLLRAFVGGEVAEHLIEQDDDGLVQMVRGELRDMMGISAAPVLTRVYRWPKANPQYEVGHLEWLAQMEQMQACTPGIFLTGSAYRGVGVPDCIHDGAAMAAGALSYVHSLAGTATLEQGIPNNIPSTVSLMR